MRDRDVRRAVLAHLAEKHRGDSTTKIVEEMGVWAGTVRIDVAVINGELSGYELKSDRDTLARLPVQADLYSRVFDQVTLVVGKRHLAKATDLIPHWWGVLGAEADGEDILLSHLRPPTRNPSPEPYLVAELLRKEEALSVLDAHGLATGWRSKRVRLIHERLASELPLPVLCQHVRETLKARKDWLSGEHCRDQLDVPVHA